MRTEDFHNCFDILHYRVLCSLILALLWIPAPTLAADGTAWQRVFPAGIEWAALCDRPGRGAALLLATPNGELQLLDTDRGRPILEAPISAGPGVRFAGCTPSAALSPTAYCFDRRAVYAIDYGPRPRLRWQQGKSAADEPPRNDPEFVPVLTTAQPVHAGVWVLAASGTLRLLAADTGTPIREVELPRLSSVVMHGRGDELTIVALAAGRPTLIRFADAQALPVTLPLAETAPIWSDLSSVGLVAAWPDALRVFDATGKITREWSFDTDQALRAADLRLSTVSETPFVAALSATDVSVFDLVKGERRSWSPPGTTQGDSARLFADANNLLLADRQSLTVLQVRGGGAIELVRVGDIDFPTPADPISAVVRGERAWILRREEQVGESTWLGSVPIGDVAKLAGPAPAEFTPIRVPERLHATIWTERLLILAGRTEVIAYRMETK